MIDYVYNTAHTALYKIYRYMDGEICTDVRLLETYTLIGNHNFEEFDMKAFWLERSVAK